MAAPPTLYQLFPLRPSAAQSSVDALVSALWRCLFPGQHFGQSGRLNQIFAMMASHPEMAGLQLCPYYFDQVTYSLPSRDLVRHMESCNLRLRCFDSWADLRQEKQRVAEQRGGRRSGADREAWPSAGIHLSRLCQLQDSNTGGSISTKQYIYLMYGYR